MATETSDGANVVIPCAIAAELHATLFVGTGSGERVHASVARAAAASAPTSMAGRARRMGARGMVPEARAVRYGQGAAGARDRPCYAERLP